MSRPRLRKLNSHSDGQALVEFALIFTFLVVLLLGMVDVGRLYMTMIALDSAAAEGASYAAIRPNQLVAAEQRAEQEGSGSQVIDESLIVADVTPPVSLYSGAPITCTVTYSFTPLFPIIGDMSFDVSRTAVANIMK